MATRGSYEHNSMLNFRGHPENVSLMYFSQNIDGSVILIHRTFSAHTTL